MSVIVVPLPPCPPVTVPAFETDQLKLLEVLDPNGIFSDALLQTEKPVPLVKAGAGLTLTLTTVGLPAQDPILEVGVTWY